MSPTSINTFTGHDCHSLSCCQLWCCFCTSLFWTGVAQSCPRTCGSWELTSFSPGTYQKHGHAHSHSCIPLSEDCCFVWGCEKLETTKGLCTQACPIVHLTTSFPLSFLSFSHPADLLCVSLSGPKLIFMVKGNLGYRSGGRNSIRTCWKSKPGVW